MQQAQQYQAAQQYQMQQQAMMQQQQMAAAYQANQMQEMAMAHQASQDLNAAAGAVNSMSMEELKEQFEEERKELHRYHYIGWTYSFY